MLYQRKNIFVSAGVYAFYNFLVVYFYFLSNETEKPLYRMYWHRHFSVLKIFIQAWAVYLLLKHCQTKYDPKKASYIVYGLYLVYACVKLYFKMTRACHRMRTDTFDNYYDGYTKVDKNFLPDFLPSSFKRGEKYTNPHKVSCKIDADSYYFCLNYYLNGYEHWSVYGGQKSCANTQSKHKSKIFKKQLEDPETEVLGWARSDNNKQNPNALNAYFTTMEYFNSVLAQPMNPAEMDTNESEFFIDFRGKKNSKYGKAVVKVKDYEELNPDSKWEVKQESAKQPSILKLYMDTTSKYRFYRKFKRTIRFLTNLKHDPDSLFQVVENTKQHNVAGFTVPNQLAYTRGVSS
jgi:hypothetical protein